MPAPDTGPLLMVVGGSSADGMLDHVELLSSKPNEQCSKAINPISGLFQLILSHCVSIQTPVLLSYMYGFLGPYSQNFIIFVSYEQAQ
jgi:hypothetical protein